MNTDIQKLRSAIMVSKCLNFSEAGYNLSFSPSAVSKHIKSLEEEMGVVLFERHSRNGVTLTNEGRMIFPVLQKVVTDLDELEGVIRSLTDNPVFWLGTPPIYPSRVTSAFVTRLSEHMPEVQLNVLHHSDDMLLDLVRLGRLDAGLANILGRLKDNPDYISIKDKNLIVEPITYDREIVLMNEGHPLAKKEPLRIDDLLRDPYNTFLFLNPTANDPSKRQNIFDNECKRRGIKCKTRTIKLELNLALDTVKRMISANPHYVAFLPYQAEFPGTVRRVLEDNFFSCQIIIFYMKNNRSRALKAFLEGAADVAKNGLIY